MRARSKSSSTETSADNRQVANTEFPPWDGSQTRQTTWFNRRLKVAMTSYATRTLIEYNVVVMPKSGNIAVFSTEQRRYQSICGALLYASTNTRPDIAFSTGLLCRAMGRPTPELYLAALRVLGYLYRNRNIGLRYVASDQSLEGFSDSDWAVKHSTSGFTFHLGSATVSWSSKKQTTVALSSCEAEIMAGSEAAKEAIYLSTFLRELGLDMSKPPPLRLDNKSAIDLAYNPEHHSKTKHIERRHYFIRECVENGKLRVPFVPTADNVADFFTKPLTGKAFFDMRDKVMNVPRHRSVASIDTTHTEK